MGSRRTPQDRAADRERDRAVLARLGGPEPSSSSTPPRFAPLSRHCWVRRGEAAVEGLLVWWLRSETGWRAEVLVVDGGLAPRVLMVDAADVRPARAG